MFPRSVRASCYQIKLFASGKTLVLILWWPLINQITAMISNRLRGVFSHSQFAYESVKSSAEWHCNEWTRWRDENSTAADESPNHLEREISMTNYFCVWVFPRLFVQLWIHFCVDVDPYSKQRLLETSQRDNLGVNLLIARGALKINSC